MAVNYHVASSDDGFHIVMTVNYMVSSDDVQLPHGF